MYSLEKNPCKAFAILLNGVPVEWMKYTMFQTHNALKPWYLYTHIRVTKHVVMYMYYMIQINLSKYAQTMPLLEMSLISCGDESTEKQTVIK